jgi:hypothetical protein
MGLAPIVRDFRTDVASEKELVAATVTTSLSRWPASPAGISEAISRLE